MENKFQSNIKIQKKKLTGRDDTAVVSEKVYMQTKKLQEENF